MLHMSQIHELFTSGLVPIVLIEADADAARVGQLDLEKVILVHQAVTRSAVLIHLGKFGFQSMW